MQPRMNNPAVSVTGALEALQALAKAANDAAKEAGVPQSTIDLLGLRASQVNGCAVCLDMHSRGARKAGETDERLATLPAWRDSPYFNDDERAVLALAEAGCRLADRSDPVPDELFRDVAKHFDDDGLAALILHIALINTWNRLNVMSGQVAGDWTARWVA